MCQFGMSQNVECEDKAVKKPTGFMTNCWGIATRLRKRCSGDHEHVRLEGNRTSKAQVYTDALCEHIMRGLVEQMYEDGKLQRGYEGVFDGC